MDVESVWRNCPSKPPESESQQGSSNCESSEFIFWFEYVAGDVTVPNGSDIMKTRKDAKEEAERNRSHSQGTLLRCEAVDAVHDRKCLHEEIKSCADHGAHDGNQENDGFGKDEVDRPQESGPQERSKRWSVVRIQSLKREGGLIALFEDFEPACEDSAGSRFAHEEEEKEHNEDDE